MKPIVRGIVAGFAGVVTAGVVVAIVEAVGHAVYPPPADLDFDDAEAVKAFVAELPVGALLFVLAAWLLGALAGTVAAGLIDRSHKFLLAIVVGGFVLLATVMNLVMIPHPVWMAVAGVVGIPAAAFVGTTLLPSRPAE